MRGFRLHSFYIKFPDGTQLHQVIYPRLLGGIEVILVTCEGERFPSALEDHPKMVMDLRPPAEDHWNVTSDRVLPATMEDFWHGWESKVPARNEAAKEAPGDVPRPIGERTTPSREQVLEATQNILTRVHALRLRSMHELGSVREVDRTLAQTLMAEFAWLHAIINEDLIKSLLALRDDLEASVLSLVSDVG